MNLYVLIMSLFIQMRFTKTQLIEMQESGRPRESATLLLVFRMLEAGSSSILMSSKPIKGRVS